MEMWVPSSACSCGRGDEFCWPTRALMIVALKSGSTSTAHKQKHKIVALQQLQEISKRKLSIREQDGKTFQIQ